MALSDLLSRTLYGSKAPSVGLSGAIQQRLPDYSDEISTGTANNVLADVLKEHPAMGKTYDASNSPQVLFGNSYRSGLAQPNQLEYWSKDDPTIGVGMPETYRLPHPTPGQTSLEIFDPNLKKNPDELKTAVYGDLLHGMVEDPQYAALRDQFKRNFTPQMLDYEKKRWGRNVSGDNSRVDEYLRGYLVDDPNDGFVQEYKAGHPIYSPQQIDIMDQMKKYLSTK